MAETKIATVDDLLALPNADAVTEEMDLAPGVRIVVGALSLLEHTRMRKECSQGDTFDQERWETLMLKHGIKEPALTFEQAEQLKTKCVATIDEVYRVVLRLSGITPRGEIAEQAVEEAEASFRKG
jgi:hypothetical protein